MDIETEEIGLYSETQVYEDLKNQCLADQTLFEDDEFPPNDESLCRFKEKPASVVWKRAKELSNNPKFIINDGKDNANDIGQGTLGDCWFLAAAASISNIPKYFNQVVPQDQSFDDGEYCGLFHFRFYRYGAWIDIVVDDYLPVDSHNNNALIYCSGNKNKNEYWVALLEKAYAKLNLCYEYLYAGQITDALVDMTGGIPEEINLKTIDKKQKGKGTDKDPDYMWNFLVTAKKHDSICGCHIKPENKSNVEGYGIVALHAYSITSFATLADQTKLIRLRNPWGHKEWTGRWSDKSNEWNSVSEQEKKRLGLVFEDNGEFWMTFDDFLKFYDELRIVHVNLDIVFDRQITNKKWTLFQFSDSWVAGENAGGSNRYSDIFWTNPQYLFRVGEVNGGKAGVIASLMQAYSRENREENNGERAEKAILFLLFRVNEEIAAEIDFESEDAETPWITKDQADYVASSSFQFIREISAKFTVDAGVYLAVPCLQKENDEGTFVLRVYVEVEE